MEIKAFPGDDTFFVQVVNAILNHIATELNPRIVTVVQIDNWFDHKWLKFSGKLLGALGIWRKDLTVPPFNPNRITQQSVFQQIGKGKYEHIEAPPLHYWQSSSDNINRKLGKLTDSGLFIWWSGNTVTHGKGSIMVYTQFGKDASSWFASLERKEPGWRIYKTKGIPIDVVNHYIKSVVPINVM